MINLLVVIVGAYIVGSIPTGYLLGRFLFGIDITAHGSGNIGATNAARVFGPRYFFIVFFIDAAKAFLYLLALSLGDLSFPVAQLSHDMVVHLAAIALLIGNAYSPFLGFNGGKGVATLCGILYALFPPYWFTWFAICWAGLLATTRRAYVSSIGATLFLVVTYAGVYAGSWNHQLYFLFWLLAWVIWRHKRNIQQELI